MSVQGKYERIDADPHFFRVVGYFRPSDYAAWAIGTAGFPALFTFLEHLQPVNFKTFTRPPASILRVCTLLGCIGGFFIAYNRSTKRFWGISENSREVKLDRYEIKEKLSKGEKPYGEPTYEPWLGAVAAKNSKNSQLFVPFIPWFNLVRHEHHDVDLKKYWEVRPGEEDWKFVLPPFEKVSEQ